MAGRFRTVDRGTGHLLPPSVDDWLSDDHLARFVVEIVDQLDCSDLVEAYDGRGSAAYHPKMLLALLFYAYSTGTFSSRKMERATYDSLAFRFICANQHPDHDTICTFRRRFLEELKDLFLQILEVAHEMDLLEVGDIALDGTKVKANASKHKALSWERACQLEEQLSKEVDELLRKAEEADQEGLPDELSVPEEIARREKRLEQIREAKRTIEERAQARYEEELADYEEKMAERDAHEEETGGKKPGPKPKPPDPGPQPDDQVNLTDEESRIMFTSQNGFQQAYNGQATVDMDTHLILTTHVSQKANDVRELVPTVEAIGRLPDRIGQPDRLTADSGYYSIANVEECEDREITPYIATGRNEHHPGWKKRLTGPGGPPPEEESGPEAMAYRLQTRAGKAFYGRRKGTAEPVFGVMKHVLGFRQFLMRGLQKVSGEFNLLACALNLRRMHALST